MATGSGAPVPLHPGLHLHNLEVHPQAWPPVEEEANSSLKSCRKLGGIRANSEGGCGGARKVGGQAGEGPC